jgi:hypothetical protein
LSPNEELDGDTVGRAGRQGERRGGDQRDQRESSDELLHDTSKWPFLRLVIRVTLQQQRADNPCLGDTREIV